MTRKNKDRIRNSIVYVILLVITYYMLFPFTYMLTSSLKQPEDIFRFPPRLLPKDQKMVDIEGLGEDLPLYYPLIDGVEKSEPYALVKKNIRTGIYADPKSPDVTYEKFVADVQPRGGYFSDQEKVVYNGEEVGLWNVDVDGVILPMIQVSQTSVGKFVSTSDLSDIVYANVRLSKPVEKLAVHPENYTDVFKLQGLFRALTNTTLVTMMVVFGQILTSIMGGYAFARLKFPGRDKLFLLYLGTYMIPFVVLTIPLYQVMQVLGWANSTTALIVPWVFTVYGTFLMKQSFLTIPLEIEEAAHIDGASRWLMLRKIFIPAVMPAIATLATFSFLYAWNSFLWPLIILKIGSDQTVLTLALQELQGRAADKVHLILAAATITILPPVLIFIAMQKHYLKSIMASGVKG